MTFFICLLCNSVRIISGEEESCLPCAYVQPLVTRPEWCICVGGVPRRPARLLMGSIVETVQLHAWMRVMSSVHWSVLLGPWEDRGPWGHGQSRCPLVPSPALRFPACGPQAWISAGEADLEMECQREPLPVSNVPLLIPSLFGNGSGCLQSSTRQHDCILRQDSLWCGFDRTHLGVSS